MSLLLPTARLAVLTGAGISAESGIPTFRGPEGYWTIGSTEYHPQEMATQRMFRHAPWEVWKWYLYRASICGHARPNRGHESLATLEQRLQDRFLLITQNVDNLHQRAGNSSARTYAIHGNIFQMRCCQECKQKLYPLPDSLWRRDKQQDITEEKKCLLTCPDCEELTRPHVLWFDECYDEQYFKFDSALRAADQADVLLILGTSGATSLPNHIANHVYQRGNTIIEICIEETVFSGMARKSPNGESIRATCSEGLDKLLEKIN